MSKQHHYLKIKPEYFRAIQKGEKTFEVRFNDRNFQSTMFFTLKSMLVTSTRGG